MRRSIDSASAIWAGLAALSLPGCASYEPAGGTQTVSVYSPYAPGSQPNPMAVEVPDPAIDRQDGGVRPADRPPQFNRIVAERAYRTPLEIEQVNAALLRLLGDGEPSRDAGPLIDALVAEPGPGASPDMPFPTQITWIRRQCGPVDDALLRIAVARVCNGPQGQYDQVRIAEFSFVNTVVDVGCTECVHRYFARLAGFTTDSVETGLDRLGYQRLGVLVGQSSFHGFRTPHVHSGFARNDGSPLIVASHFPRSPPGQDDKQRSRSPGVRQLWLFFPVDRIGFGQPR